MQLVHFAPYVPGETEPWDPKATAAHLLRRSGFGAAREDVERWANLDLPTRVQELFDEAEDQEAQFQETLHRVSNALLSFGELANLQAWWCYRMLQTRTPLREKLALFWHGHFATSFAKVIDPGMMLHQLDTLRAKAWGNFPDLVLAVCRDPAMLVYLDGAVNTKEAPNENFGRELLELFTLGKGHYTEIDVRAAARAFTGWTYFGLEFAFVRDAHDDGPKEFLGQTGPWDGTDIVNILAQHPALPPFIARKLLVFFACPEPPPEVVAEAAAVFQAGGLNVKAFLSALFVSKFFYSPACRRTRIASPVELVIGTCRRLKLRLPAQRLTPHLDAMGQSLFAPPSVKGWDGEKRWINSTTWEARLDFAHEVATLNNSNEYFPHLDLARLTPAVLVHPGMIVDHLVEGLLDGNLDPKKRAELAEFLVSDDGKPQPDKFRTDTDFRDMKIRAAVEILMSLPEYHLT